MTFRNSSMLLVVGLLSFGGCSSPQPSPESGVSAPGPLTAAEKQLSNLNEPLELQLPEHPTLADCLAYAETNSPGLAAALARWQAEAARVPQATALPDPTISYTNMPKPRAMPQRHIVGVSQTFPWLGKLVLLQLNTDRRVALFGQTHPVSFSKATSWGLAAVQP